MCGAEKGVAEDCFLRFNICLIGSIRLLPILVALFGHGGGIIAVYSSHIIA